MSIKIQYRVIKEDNSYINFISEKEAINWVENCSDNGTYKIELIIIKED